MIDLDKTIRAVRKANPRFDHEDEGQYSARIYHQALLAIENGLCVQTGPLPAIDPVVSQSSDSQEEVEARPITKRQKGNKND